MKMLRIITILTGICLLCGCKQTEHLTYSDKALGIKIDIPPGWRRVSPKEVGDDYASPGRDLILLGYYEEGNDEEMLGVCAVSVICNAESPEDMERIEQLTKEFKETTFKGHNSWLYEETTDEGTTGFVHSFIRKKQLIGFLVSHSEGRKELINDILKNTHFEQDSPSLSGAD